MTTIAKLGLSLIIIILLAGGGIWYANKKGTEETPVMATEATTTSMTDATSTATSTLENQSGTNLSKDNSDASLARDMTSIDAQMNGLSSDSASADQGLNDKPVSQQ